MHPDSTQRSLPETAPPSGARRDLGTPALVAAALSALLALAQPLSTLTATGGTGGTGTSTTGWFGTVTTTVAGTVSTSAGAAPALGWAVLAGMALVATAVVLRLRTGTARSTALAAGTWFTTTGVLVVLHGHDQAARERDVLARVVPDAVVLAPSASPWLLVVGGVLATLAVLARPRAPVVRAGRTPAPGVVVWTPVEPPGPRS